MEDTTWHSLDRLEAQASTLRQERERVHRELASADRRITCLTAQILAADAPEDLPLRLVATAAAIMLAVLAIVWAVV